MTKIKECRYNIAHCNSRCAFFFYNYWDDENIWCGILEKKIFDATGDVNMRDVVMRPFPPECPLEDVKI